MDDKIYQKIEQLETTVTEMKTVLYGVQGKGGILNDVEEIKKKQDLLLKTMYVGMGALAVLNFIAPFIIKNFAHV